MKTFAVIITLFLLASCGKPENPPERNKLVFDVPIENIEDSIQVMNEFFKKFPPYENLEMVYFNYIYNENRINTEIIGDYTFENLVTNKFFKIFSSTELKRFISLFHYLKRNYVKPKKHDFVANISYYVYRDYDEIKDPQDWYRDLNRMIIYSEKKEKINVEYYKILDVKSNLYLLAFDNARIWADEE